MKYSLYDTYETEIEPGELICTSDDYAEIIKAAKLRNAEISEARNVAMFICRDYLEIKYEKIGQIFGGRKHTTVMHGCNNVDENKELKKKAEEIYKLIT